MDVKKVLRMNSGEGEFSYVQNNAFTRKETSRTKPVLEKTIQDFFSKDFLPCKVLNAVDLGCSSTPNTFSVISTIIDSVEKKCEQLSLSRPQLQIFLNDLPGNDFNSLFRSLPEVGLPCFFMGVPGSFYWRLFPKNSLHFVHSSYSVHWLSQVPLGLTCREGMPLNKGKMYISKTSPPAVARAYIDQFQEDFTLFLKLRSEEMVPNGRAVLILHGRQGADPSRKESCYPWELLAEAMALMVSQGLVDEEKLDSFNVPYYTPSQEEVQEVVEREGSFKTEQLEMFELDDGDEEEMDVWAKGEKIAKNVRAFTEPVISYHFGEEILEKLYDKFTHLLVEDLTKQPIKVISIIIVLRKIGSFT